MQLPADNITDLLLTQVHPTLRVEVIESCEAAVGGGDVDEGQTTSLFF